jgi:hypothetical protein
VPEPVLLTRLREVVERALREAPDEDTIARARLVPVDADALHGCSEKRIVGGPRGSRFVFKVPPRGRAAFEAELFSTQVRRRCGMPSVANVAQRVEIDGVVVDGYVKPFVPNGGVLGCDPERWTELQRTAVLVDHAFAELCGNYDTKPSQYLVVGCAAAEEDGATNVDWDRALFDHAKFPDARGRLTRH